MDFELILVALAVMAAVFCLFKFWGNKDGWGQYAGVCVASFGVMLLARLV